VKKIRKITEKKDSLFFIHHKAIIARRGGCSLPRIKILTMLLGVRARAFLFHLMIEFSHHKSEWGLIRERRKKEKNVIQKKPQKRG
jgi:hypothetical protein